MVASVSHITLKSEVASRVGIRRIRTWYGRVSPTQTKIICVLLAPYLILRSARWPQRFNRRPRSNRPHQGPIFRFIYVCMLSNNTRLLYNPFSCALANKFFLTSWAFLAVSGVRSINEPIPPQPPSSPTACSSRASECNQYRCMSHSQMYCNLRSHPHQQYRWSVCSWHWNSQPSAFFRTIEVSNAKLWALFKLCLIFIITSYYCGEKIVNNKAEKKSMKIEGTPLLAEQPFAYRGGDEKNNPWHWKNGQRWWKSSLSIRVRTAEMTYYRLEDDF